MMKHGQNNRRNRSRGNGKRYPNQRGGAFESSGPDVKVRGTAQQVFEKYLALARDASATGDRIASESYMQHAEHYYRIINAEAENGNNRNRPQRPNRGFDEFDDDDTGMMDGDMQPQFLRQEASVERRGPANGGNGGGNGNGSGNGSGGTESNADDMTGPQPDIVEPMVAAENAPQAEAAGNGEQQPGARRGRRGRPPRQRGNADQEQPSS